VGLLHTYATHLKKTLLLGNILISLFVASVPVLIYLAEYENINSLNEPRLIQILILYCALAFLANLMREIVKDIQDVKGDKAYGAKTFPILFGHRKSKILLASILILLLSLILYWAFYFDASNQNFIRKGVGTIPLAIVAAILLISLPNLESAKHYGNWSNGIKLFMLFGLVFLYLQTS
jgi:4-hydroxybenzoate polyprenyltransferase